MTHLDRSDLQPCTIGGVDCKGLLVLQQETIEANGQSIPGLKTADGIAVSTTTSLPLGKQSYEGPLLHNGTTDPVTILVWVLPYYETVEVTDRTGDGWLQRDGSVDHVKLKSMGAPSPLPLSN